MNSSLHNIWLRAQREIKETLLHIVKIPTFYLRRYGQNCPYCRKIEEIYKKKKIMLPDNVALATFSTGTSLLPRFPLERLSCHVCEAVCRNCHVNVTIATLTSLLPRFPLERLSCHVCEDVCHNCHVNVALATFST
jgi:hypothetical protein